MDLSQPDGHRTASADQAVGFKDAVRGAHRRLAAQRRQLETAAQAAHGAARLRRRAQDLHMRQASALKHIRSTVPSPRPPDSTQQLLVLFFQKTSALYREWLVFQGKTPGETVPAPLHQSVQQALQQIEQTLSLLREAPGRPAPLLRAAPLHRRLLSLQRERLRALRRQMELRDERVYHAARLSTLPRRTSLSDAFDRACALGRKANLQIRRLRLSARRWLMHPIVDTGDPSK